MGMARMMSSSKWEISKLEVSKLKNQLSFGVFYSAINWAAIYGSATMSAAIVLAFHKG